MNNNQYDNESFEPQSQYSIKKIPQDHLTLEDLIFTAWAFCTGVWQNAPTNLFYHLEQLASYTLTRHNADGVDTIGQIIGIDLSSVVVDIIDR